jgi:hypothetical protein
VSAARPCPHPPKKRSHETDDTFAPLFGAVPILHREYVVCEACGERIEETATQHDGGSRGGRDG